MAGGLILVMFKYTSQTIENRCLDEERDKDTFHPDGISIAYVLSNFCNEYHPDYVNLSKEAIELNKQKFKEFNNNRGRKRKDKKKKNKKKNNGSNDEFGSCISFGVIFNDRVHGVKMFRTESGNISKLTCDDVSSETYIKNMLGVLFSYINMRKPVCIRYLSHYVALENITSEYSIPNNHFINLEILRSKLNLGQYTPDYWECENVLYNFNGKVNHLKAIISEDLTSDRTTNIKLAPDGKIHVYGSKDRLLAEKYVRLLFQIINTYADELIKPGVRASKKPGKRPDFTKKLDY